jgi:hypothetical protein
MRKPLVFLLQLFVLLGFMNQAILSQKRDFQIELSTEKSVFVEQEEIILNIKVINKSNRIDSVWICGEDYNFVNKLNVTDDKGKKYKYAGVMIDCMDYYVKLYPGRFLEWDVPILFSYGEIESNLTLHWYLEEGLYEISFNGKPGQNNPVMKSNEIKLEIKKPGDADGFEELKRISTFIDGLDKLDSLIKFINIYPGSAYLDIAFLKCLSLSKYYQGNFGKMYNVIELFFSLKNKAWNIDWCLKVSADFVKKLKGEDRKIEFLAYVIKRYPDSKASSTAYSILRRKIPNDIYIKMLLN